MPTWRRGTAILAIAFIVLGGSNLAASSASSSQPHWSVIQQHDHGLAVRAAQTLLEHRGYQVPLDGYFGAKTVRAVKRFQNDEGLAPTGKIGGATWPSLIVVVRQGDSGELVRVVQRMLSTYYRIKVDGEFGPQTKAVVERLQEDARIPVNGIVQKLTWKHLTVINGPSCLGGECG